MRAHSCAAFLILVCTVLLAVFLAGCADPAPVETPALEPSPPVQATATVTRPAPTPLPASSPTVEATATVTLPAPTPLPEPSPTVPPAGTAPAVEGFPPQPEGVPFPAESWPEGAWPAGVDRAIVDAAVDEAFADGAVQRVRAVVIVHGGQIVYERYSPNLADHASAMMPGYSIAKSITAMLVGILVRDGRLDVEQPAAVAEWATPGDLRGEITLDDLLRMSSGLEWDQGRPPGFGDQGQMLGSIDAAAYAAEKELLHPPGTAFLYSSGNTMIIDRILAGEVGSGEAFEAFMRAELLDKIGLQPINLQFDPAGTWHGWFGADTTARDFARIGLLALRDGVWDGERILPEGWMEYSRTPSATNPEYGAGWWLDLARPGVFYAVGVNGQTIAVDPAHDLAFVTLATDSAISLPVSEAILDAFAGE